MSSDAEKRSSVQQDPEPEAEVHPDYNDHESDLTLVSGDGRHFRVHSLIMKLASDVFKTMIGVAPVQGSSEESISVQENGDIIKDLLDVIYPNKLPFRYASPTFEHFRQVCYAAEKYEMPGVLQVMQLFLRTMIENVPPLLAFALAAHYEWPEELRLISTATLKLDLYCPQSIEDLHFIPTHWLLKLMELHRSRRKLLVASLDWKNSQVTMSPYSIAQSSVTLDCIYCNDISNHFSASQWGVLKLQISEEMERKSDGSSIREESFWLRAEFEDLWHMTCDECHETDETYSDSTSVIDQHKLKTQVIRVLDSLPKTIP
ncbi:hypothetical protein ACEPAG_4032 [Sanghuangporus baumii]